MKILYILLAVFIFGMLITVHELGHYIFARIFKVKIYEFSIGMGPKIFSVRSKKTDIKYSLGIFPIGGYVSMAGEDEESDEPNSLDKKPVWQRMIITAAGAFMNLVLGFVLMLVLVSNTVVGTTVVADFLPMETTGYTVSTEGTLMPYDEIIEIDGARVHTAAELDYEIMHSEGGALPVTVIRNGEELDLTVIFPTVVSGGNKYGGRDFRIYAERERSFGSVMKHAWFRSTSTVKMVCESLVDLVRGRYGFEAVSGPVGVTSVITDAASSKDGWLNVIYLTGVITINLGVFNLLPIPALDGGRLVFLLVELIRRKPAPPKVEGYVNGIGLLILFGLMIAVTFKDVFVLIFN